ncbi:MAG: ABC transporter ATP-binding protein [Clostridia bacterium]|nr:ABC transporter ATP-binding protein [Clostridia bacterium]
MKKGNKKSTVSRVLGYIGKHKYLLPVSFFLAFIYTFVSLAIPYFIGEAIDCIVGVGSVDFEKISGILLLCILLTALAAISSFFVSVINNRIAYSVTRDMRAEAFKKIQKLPLAYIDTTSHGDTVNRIINDTDRFSEGLLLGFTQVFTGILTIFGTLLFMFMLSWQIAIVVVVLTPLSIFIAKFIGSKTYSMFIKRSEDEAEAAAFISEMVENQKLIRAFNKEESSKERFFGIGKRLEKSTLNAIFLSSLTNPTTRFVNSIVYAAVVLVGAILIISGDPMGAVLTIGEFSILLSYTNQYTKPFNEISGIIAEFQGALASAARVFDLIEQENESEDGTIVIQNADGEVLLKDVSFSYSDDKPLIDALNLSVSRGERIAIVGPTGCGKTTLINLLMRFYDAKSGQISLDGHELRSLTRHSLRSCYGMVLQDTWLTAGSVKDNIAFGKPDATDEEIVNAAKSAHAHSFIKRLEHGYDTILGEGGDGLSAGQKQLICIARIMLTSPNMLILDEATSSIDTRTEMKIQSVFAQIMTGRTSFIVAHRLSTVREADLILVMRDGKIIETGKHEQLLSRGGFYSQLYNSQFAH